MNHENLDLYGIIPQRACARGLRQSLCVCLCVCVCVCVRVSLSVCHHFFGIIVHPYVATTIGVSFMHSAPDLYKNGFCLYV